MVIYLQVIKTFVEHNAQGKKDGGSAGFLTNKGWIQNGAILT